MNVAKMRLLDRWLGTPVCLVLTLLARLFGRRPPEYPAKPRRLLFIKLAEQGSTVLAQGALRQAIRRYGKSNVFFLLFAENRPILDLLDLVPPQNVIAIDAANLGRAIVSSLAAIWRLRRLGIDAAVDLEFFARSSAALCYLSGARWRAGYHSFGGEGPYRGNLLTHRLAFNPYLHTSQTFQVLVEALEQPAGQLPTFAQEPPPPLASATVSFQPGRAELAEMTELLGSRLGSRPQRLILLNANASDLMPLRRWQNSRYVELARQLLNRYPEVCIVFTGAPAEAAAVEKLVDQVGSPRCLSLAGQTTLRQLLVLCCLAEVLVTNDSGPAHFASLTPVDVIVLFGPETPRLFAAASARTHPLWAGLICSPCLNAFNNRTSPCTNNVCMQRLTVTDVYSTVCNLYQQRLSRETGPARRAKPHLYSTWPRMRPG